MRMSESVEWGAHCLVLLAMAPGGAALPAARLAEYHDVPAAYLAKHLQALAKAGLLEPARGPGGGYRLARPADDVTLLDVVEALDGTEPAFRCTEIRRRGPAAASARHYRARCAVHRGMLRADESWRAELRATTIADLAADVLADAPPAALEKGAAWLREVLS